MEHLRSVLNSRSFRILPGLLLSASLSGGPPPPRFDQDRAFAHLEQQCAFGPRNPGSQGYQAGREYLLSTLRSFADTVMTQPFTSYEPRDGVLYALTNIIGRFNPGAARRILLGAHWDTRPWADRDPDLRRRAEPILGANDGASGVAVLLELARILHETPLPLGVDIVFFDGEDLGRQGNLDSYARGSREFAKKLPVPKPDYAIILDMIGDTELHLPVERNSHNQNPELVRRLWLLARDLDLPAFDSRIGPAVFDDHVPLWEEAGIPAVDIIDLDYPNPWQNYWHTHQDLPRHCSPESLGQVGRLLVQHLYGTTGR